MFYETNYTVVDCLIYKMNISHKSVQEDELLQFQIFSSHKTNIRQRKYLGSSYEHTLLMRHYIFPIVSLCHTVFNFGSDSLPFWCQT